MNTISRVIIKLYDKYIWQSFFFKCIEYLNFLYFPIFSINIMQRNFHFDKYIYPELKKNRHFYDTIVIEGKSCRTSHINWKKTPHDTFPPYRPCN